MISKAWPGDLDARLGNDQQSVLIGAPALGRLPAGHDVDQPRQRAHLPSVDLHGKGHQARAQPDCQPIQPFARTLEENRPPIA